MKLFVYNRFKTRSRCSIKSEQFVACERRSRRTVRKSDKKHGITSQTKIYSPISIFDKHSRLIGSARFSLELEFCFISALLGIIERCGCVILHLKHTSAKVYFTWLCLKCWNLYSAVDFTINYINQICKKLFKWKL